MRTLVGRYSVVSDTESHITASVRLALPVPVNLEDLLAGIEVRRGPAKPSPT